jgi:DNA-binding IclR family transcriptional regulator
MRELNGRSGETVLFAVFSEDGEWVMTYVDIVETLKTIRVTVTIGDRRPLWCTAGGRILLAARSDDEVGRYLDRIALDRLTPSTNTERTHLLEAVRRARVDDLALVSDELVSGVTGVAAPIRDAAGSVLGALIVGAPTMRLTDGGAELASLVSESARAISHELGCRKAAA